jgi:hypothetical protein
MTVEVGARHGKAPPLRRACPQRRSRLLHLIGPHAYDAGLVPTIGARFDEPAIDWQVGNVRS